MIKGEFMTKSAAIFFTPLGAYLTYVFYQEGLTLLVMLFGIGTLYCLFRVLDETKKRPVVIVGGVRRRRIRRIWWRL